MYRILKKTVVKTRRKKTLASIISPNYSDNP